MTCGLMIDTIGVPERDPTVIGETNHRVLVVGDENPVLRCRPVQDLGVRGALGQGVLGADRVDFGQDVCLLIFDFPEALKKLGLAPSLQRLDPFPG
jgi:hypothetical protein